MTLADKLKGAKVQVTEKRQQPLWKGPTEDGITFSLLSRFLVDRERFYILTVEGLRPKEHFSHRLEFGSMWHLCEEEYAKGGSDSKRASDGFSWQGALKAYARKLCDWHRMSQQEIDHWYEIIKVEFPQYVDWWTKNPDVDERSVTRLLSEQIFAVPYKLPSGRMVKLKGKWDGVDLIKPKSGGAGIYLFETKTKGEIESQQIERQLLFDLQTMIYLVALSIYQEDVTGHSHKTTDKVLSQQYPIKGVRYNVIKRPRQYQGKRETKEQFLARLSVIIRDSPQDFFARWKVEVRPTDQQRFRREALDPILEQLCDWWEHISRAKEGRFKSDTGLHFRMPYGVYNPLLEGRGTEYDEYLNSGSLLGLEQAKSLFRELE